MGWAALIVLVVLAGVWFVLGRTTAGLVLSAAGEAPEAVDALGYRIPVVRTLATVAGSSLPGLAGAMLVCGPLGLFVQNVTAGRGWVALALVVFARWRPDRQPPDCRYDQLEVTTPYELERVFGAGRAPG